MKAGVAVRVATTVENPAAGQVLEVKTDVEAHLDGGGGCGWVGLGGGGCLRWLLRVAAGGMMMVRV